MDFIKVPIYTSNIEQQYGNTYKVRVVFGTRSNCLDVRTYEVDALGYDEAAEVALRIAKDEYKEQTNDA